MKQQVVESKGSNYDQVLLNSNDCLRLSS